METLGVVHLSTVLKENSLEEIRSIHKTLENHGYYNGDSYILVKKRFNTEPLEEAFDLDYLIDLFIEEKNQQEVIQELLLEEDLIENLLKIELVDVYVDVDGNVVKIGNKYY